MEQETTKQWAVSMEPSNFTIPKKARKVSFPKSRDSCYRNAAMAAMVEGWLYVEGIANGAHFAWNISEDGLIDLTAEQHWEMRGKTYLYRPLFVKTGDELRMIYRDRKDFGPLARIVITGTPTGQDVGFDNL